MTADDRHPLDGILIADFSRVLAGPFATMALADLGATVVKVEQPGSGDETRAWGPPWTASSSAYFDGVNRSKYSVALDLSAADDLSAAQDLARRADVVVQNFRPGGLTRFGLDHPSVARSNPAVVYCSISGFGAGAGADRPGYDFLVQAVGGLMGITGEADGDALKVGVALVDVLTGKDAVIGILAALTRRARTGRGDHVQVELLSSLLGGLVNQASTYLTTGVPPRRMGNRHPSIAPYETLRCADGPIAVACGNDRQFARLTEVIGRPELAADPRFTRNPDRVAHRDELQAVLEAELRRATSAEWERLFTAAGVPAGIIGDIGSAIERAVALGLEPLVEPGIGHSPQIRHPVTYADARVTMPAPPPHLGEHTELVRDWLASAEASLLPRTATPVGSTKGPA